METEYDDFAAEFGKFPDPSDGSKLLWESMDGDDKQEKIDRAWSLEDQRWLEAGSAGVWRQVGVYIELDEFVMMLSSYLWRSVGLLDVILQWAHHSVACLAVP